MTMTQFCIYIFCFCGTSVVTPRQLNNFSQLHSMQWNLFLWYKYRNRGFVSWGFVFFREFWQKLKVFPTIIPITFLLVFFYNFAHLTSSLLFCSVSSSVPLKLFQSPLFCSGNLTFLYLEWNLIFLLVQHFFHTSYLERSSFPLFTTRIDRNPKFSSDLSRKNREFQQYQIIWPSFTMLLENKTRLINHRSNNITPSSVVKK